MDISPIDLQKALSGADYPANKQQLLERAKGNNAGDDVTSALDALPDNEYDTPAAVSKAVAAAN